MAAQFSAAACTGPDLVQGRRPRYGRGRGRGGRGRAWSSPSSSGAPHVSAAAGGASPDLRSREVVQGGQGGHAVRMYLITFPISKFLIILILPIFSFIFGFSSGFDYLFSHHFLT